MVQTYDNAVHPVDVTLEWSECVSFQCNGEASTLQAEFTCAGKIVEPHAHGGEFDAVIIWWQSGQRCKRFCYSTREAEPRRAEGMCLPPDVWGTSA